MSPRPGRAAARAMSHGAPRWLQPCARRRRTGEYSFSILMTGAKASCMRSEEHTSELQSLMRISYAVFCLKKKNRTSQLTAHATHQQLTHIKQSYQTKKL